MKDTGGGGGRLTKEKKRVYLLERQKQPATDSVNASKPHWDRSEEERDATKRGGLPHKGEGAIFLNNLRSMKGSKLSRKGT